MIIICLGNNDLAPLVHAAEAASIPARAIYCNGNSKRLVELDHSKNQDPSSPYHIKWPECKEMQIETAEEVNAVLQMQKTSILVRSPPLFSLMSKNNQPKVHMTSQIDSNAALPVCRWLISHLPMVESFSVHLEQMSSRSFQPLRSSGEGKLIIQISGRSRVLLVPPSLTSLAPFCRSHPLHRYSAVGMAATASSEVDASLVKHVADLWPHSLEIKGISCILSAEETLFVPPEYSVHMESLLESSVSLVVSLKTSAPPSPLAAVVSSASIIERWVDHEIGVSGSRKFLISLIDLWKRHEAEMEAFVGSISIENPFTAAPRHWSDIWPRDTVKGYKLLRLSMEVFQVCATLVTIDPSMKRPHRVLESMIQGRMLPTPWLNEYGLQQNQVPSSHLSLTWNYPAPLLEEAEQVYPALFSRQIKLKEDKAAEKARNERLTMRLDEASLKTNTLQ